MVSLDISNDGKHTGALLQEYLEKRGVYDPKARATVCYGIPHRDVPNMINGHRKGNGKMKNMELMQKAGCRTVPWYLEDGITEHTRFPMLARKNHGMGGQDIVPVFQPEEIPWRIASGWEWFSSYVPLKTEYRVWIWRGEHLDTYEKVMQRPNEYLRIGRNFKNGFNFIPCKEVKEVTAQAILAVKAIGLDFAAVDLLLGKDGLVYVLEVNTAPGVIQSEAFSTLEKLADKITEWVNNGYPKW